MNRNHHLRYRSLCTPVVVISMFTSLMSTATSAAVSSSSQPVTIHQHVNYRGHSLGLGEGDLSFLDLKNSSVGNDRISSIQIDSGYEVLACQHGGFRGRCETFTSSTSDLRTISFNDIISSLRVSKAEVLPVTVYQHIKFRGNSLSIGEGDLSFRELKNSVVGNDTISSIQIESGYEVLACQHSRFRGRCETFTNSTTDLRTISFNDVISSLRVQKITEEPPVENRAPVASDVFFTTNANEVFNFSIGDLQPSVTDADGDALSISVPDNELLTVESDGTFSYDPISEFGDLPVGESATIDFTYTVTDGLLSDTGLITITIEGTVTGPQTYNIGDMGPGGGTVFSISADGTSGLEFAPQVFSDPIAWGCFGIDLPIPNVGSVSITPITEVQSGLLNSSMLLDNTECVTPAAQQAFDYETTSVDVLTNFDNWFLPSIEELLQIQQQFSDIAIQDQGSTLEIMLSTLNLWSSTEHTNDLVWVLIQNGDVTPAPKNFITGNTSISVLPIRAF